MQVKQFEDKNLSHYSYAILSDQEIVLIDPARDPQPYYDFAEQNHAKILAVIETHPHADFVSGHLEISNFTGAAIYVSKLLGAEYPHQTFDDGDAILIGQITLKAINTPGHSPDSISILAFDNNGKEVAVFTGDTLFIGDCGRPDLREKRVPSLPPGPNWQSRCIIRFTKNSGHSPMMWRSILHMEPAVYVVKV